jgi:hypothetical protein
MVRRDNRIGNSMLHRIPFVLAYCTVLALLAGVGRADRPAADAVVPLANAHAHNDYAHRRPLADALDHGFCSVEADIFLIDGKLLVAHNRFDVAAERTLEKLYLDPLRQRVNANGGHVYRVREGAGEGGARVGGVDARGTSPEFTLLVDIKSAAEPTYAALAKTLAGYADVLTVVRDGKLEKKAIAVVISGNRAHKAIADDKIRYAGIDGRLSDLDSDAPAHLLPLVSDNWQLHFRWRGAGPMPDDERKKLSEIVAKAHAKGRRVRFWATPEKPEVWRELAAAGVDHINTDDLPGLRKFLSDQTGKAK